MGSSPGAGAGRSAAAGLLSDTPSGSVRRPIPLSAGLLTDIAVTPLSETIRRLSRERRSGDLFVRSRRSTKLVFFDEGRVVFAASNVRKERLGEALVALGKITNDDFLRASTLVMQRRVRFGDALVAVGVMQKDEVGATIVGWIEQVVVALFDLRSGSASFEDRPCVIPPEYRLELNVERILQAGIRTMSRNDHVVSALGSLDQRVVCAGPPPLAPEGCESEILSLAKSPVTLRRLAWGSDGLAPDRLRALYALLAAGALQDPAAKAPAPPRAVVVAPPAAPAPPRRPMVDAAVRNEIRDQLARSEALDLQKWLGLAPEAPKAAVLQSLEQRRLSYELLRPRLAGDVELNTDLELLISRVTMAVRLAQRAPAPPKAPEPAPPPLPSPQSVAPAAPAPASAEAQNASMEVEHLRMEANIRMSVGDFTNAVRTLTRLVQLQPTVAEHYLRLGIAMSRSPRTAREAQAELEEAVRLEPKNPEMHYQLGLYFKARNVRSRAQAAFKAALDLNPRHAKARAEMEGAAAPESALGTLKKLLG